MISIPPYSVWFLKIKTINFFGIVQVLIDVKMYFRRTETKQKAPVSQLTVISFFFMSLIL